MNLTPELRARIDAHLDAVEKALMASGHTRERRRGVVDDLEAQIHEMLAAKSESPTLSDLEEVLAKLDPPAAYADGTPRPVAPPQPLPPRTPALAAQTAPVPAPTPAPALTRPRYSRTAIWGLVCILVSGLLVPLMFAVVFLFAAQHAVAPPPVFSSRPPVIVNGGPEQPMDPEPPEFPQRSIGPAHGFLPYSTLACMFTLIGPLAIAGTVLGWVAFGQIRRSAGMIRGLGMALFDGLFYPLLFLIFSALTPLVVPIVALILVAAGIAVIILVVRLAKGQRVFG